MSQKKKIVFRYALGKCQNTVTTGGELTNVQSVPAKAYVIMVAGGADTYSVSRTVLMSPEYARIIARGTNAQTV